MNDNLQDNLLTEIRGAIDNHPRTLQKHIGPSEIGHPCRRRVAYILGGFAEVNQSDHWKPTVGTAVHAWLADVFDRADYTAMSEGKPSRWLVEESVHTGTLAGEEIIGSSDLFDILTGTVVDWKIVGPRMLRKYRTEGPSAEYRCQGHDYGRGWVRKGYTVNRVAIFFLPRDGNLKDAWFWSENFDPTIPEAIYKQVEPLATLMRHAPTGMRPDILAATPTVSAYCAQCPFYRRDSDDLTTGCPGDPAMHQREETVPIDSLLTTR